MIDELIDETQSSFNHDPTEQIMTIKTQAVEYTHNNTLCQGTLVWDDKQSGPRPGVMVSHAWAGRTEFEDGKAHALAELGYVGFAVDLYGKGITGSSKEENGNLMKPFLDDRKFLRSRLQCAMQAMQDQDTVDSSNTAIIGYCFGGLCALDLARSDADLKAAVSLHGLFVAPELDDNPSSIRTKVLALHGWDDPMAQPASVLALAQEMTALGADWQVHAYGNTMHAFTNPAANDPDFGTVYNEDADKRSWQAVANLLAEVFA